MLSSLKMTKRLAERAIAVDDSMAGFSNALAGEDAASAVALARPAVTPAGTPAPPKPAKPQLQFLQKDIYRNWAESEGSDMLKKLKAFFRGIGNVEEVEVK